MIENRATIEIGNVAGHHFPGPADLIISRHAVRRLPNGRTERGYFVTRKWLANRAAFDCDPTLGWAYEHWFEWLVIDAKVRKKTDE